MDDMVRRNNAVDLIKGLSMLIVVSYHFYEWAGAYMAVDFFFVISGYFITSSLIEKEENYFKFLSKRLVRIYPVLLAILVFTLFSFIYFNGFLNKNITYSSLSSLFGLSNIYQIVKKISYFERTEEMFPLIHTWTLAIEIQFYIFFPLFIYSFKKLKNTSKTNFYILTIFSFISAGIMFYKSYFNYSVNDIYYGTDTRIFALFIGAASYFYSLSKNINKKILKNMGIFSLITVFFSMLSVTYFMKINYYGLIYVMSVLKGIVILAILKTDLLSFNNKFLEFFSNLGKKSYSYYMWQYPIMIFSLEYYKWSDINYEKTVLIQLFILIIVAEISYFLFENNKKRANSFGLALFIIYLGTLFFAPFQKETKASEISSKIEITKKIEIEDKRISIDSMEERLLGELAVPVVEEKIIIEKTETPKLKLENNEKNIEKETKKIKEDDFIDGSKYTFVGDSVMKGSEKLIKKKYKGAYIDTKVSRQFIELPKILRKIKKNNGLNEIVIIHLGSNGLITKKAFEETVNLLGNRKVFFINCVVPKRWEKSINKLLIEWTVEYKNIKIIDWYSTAKGKKELFNKDACHPNIAGRKVYTKMIFENIK